MSDKEALERFGDFKIGEKVIHTVIYADYLVLLAKEETMLQGMIDRYWKLLWNGSECGKTKVMRIPRQPS
jgi:hypothetical protein